MTKLQTSQTGGIVTRLGDLLDFGQLFKAFGDFFGHTENDPFLRFIVIYLLMGHPRNLLVISNIVTEKNCRLQWDWNSGS